MMAWLKQTSTRTALGTLATGALTAAQSVAAGQLDWRVALINLIPIAYGALVSDKTGG